MRVAILGAGFWANYQVAAWQELAGVKTVAISDINLSAAHQIAETFGMQAYDSVEALLKEARPDVVDVITPVETHSNLVKQVIAAGVPVICQKPMGTDLADAEAMVEAARAANVPFFVHENWRFQTPLRRVQEILTSGVIGTPFRARIQFNCSFPVFDNQPFLKTLPQFILTDIGSHILDTARFLFGEATSLYCHTSKVNPEIAGEDVATVMMRMTGCETLVCEMSYASRLADESFPQTYVVIEGSQGSIELRKDFQILSPLGREIALPPSYSWADPAYDLVHSSIVACHQAIVDDLRGESDSGLRGVDNLKTVDLVFLSYKSENSRSAFPVP